MVKTVSQEVVLKKMRVKQHFHNLLRRKGWFLPRWNTNICTEAWLKKVRKKEIYCPKIAEIKYRECFDIPTNKEIVKHLKIELERKGKNIGVPLDGTSSKLPDKQWMLLTIATLNEHYEMFTGTY